VVDCWIIDAHNDRRITRIEVTMAKSILAGFAATYIIIGALHSAFFSIFISRSDCINPKGLVSAFCNTGMGISHFVVMLGWPLYWV